MSLAFKTDKGYTDIKKIKGLKETSLQYTHLFLKHVCEKYPSSYASTSTAVKS